MLDALGEHRLDGFMLPFAEQPLEPPILPHRLNEQPRFLSGQLGVDEPALLEAAPLIVRPMAGSWIVSTATPRLPAHAGPMLERARADIVHPRQLLLNPGNPLPRLGAHLRRCFRGRS